MDLCDRRAPGRRAAARRATRASTPTTTASPRSSRRSGAASCSCASRRACRRSPTRWRRTRRSSRARRSRTSCRSARRASQTRHVNWKNVADNYSDGLHIPVAHPGLMRIFGKSYAIEAREWVDKMSGELVDQPSPHRLRAHVPEAHARHGPRRGRDLGLLQALAERGDRAVPGPDRLHAVHPGHADRDAAPLHQLRAAGRAARDEGRALPQLAHQPAGEPRGQGPDRARAGRHGLLELYGRPAGRRRGVPAQLRAAHARAVPGGARGHAAAEGLEHQPQGAAARSEQRGTQAALRAPGRERPARGARGRDDREPEALRATRACRCAASRPRPASRSASSTTTSRTRTRWSPRATGRSAGGSRRTSRRPSRPPAPIRARGCGRISTHSSRARTSTRRC